VFCILPSRAGHATAAAAAAEKAVVTNVVLSERCGRNNRKTNNDGSFEKGEEGNRVMIKSGKTFQTASYLEFLWPGNIGDRHLWDIEFKLLQHPSSCMKCLGPSGIITQPAPAKHWVVRRCRS
jgi:hypothetical protein